MKHYAIFTCAFALFEADVTFEVLDADNNKIRLSESSAATHTSLPLLLSNTVRRKTFGSATLCLDDS